MSFNIHQHQGLEALVVPHSGLKNPILYPEGGYISSIPLGHGAVYYGFN